MRTKILCFLMIAFFSTACTTYLVKYNIYPTSPNIESKLYGRYTYQFSQDSLTFQIDPDAIEIGFSITNNAYKSVFFVWDSVKVFNINRKIFYSKFHPSVSPKDTLTEITNKKIFRDVLPVEDLLVYKGKSETELEKIAKESVGDKILIELPVMKEEKYIVYKLEFVVKAYQVRENR